MTTPEQTPGQPSDAVLLLDGHYADLDPIGRDREILLRVGLFSPDDMPELTFDDRNFVRERYKNGLADTSKDRLLGEIANQNYTPSFSEMFNITHDVIKNLLGPEIKSRWQIYNQLFEQNDRIPRSLEPQDMIYIYRYSHYNSMQMARSVSQGVQTNAWSDELRLEVYYQTGQHLMLEEDVVEAYLRSPLGLSPFEP